MLSPPLWRFSQVCWWWSGWPPYVPGRPHVCLTFWPFSYAVIASLTGVPACTHSKFIVLKYCEKLSIPNNLSLSFPLSFYRATHDAPEIPAILTPSALRTCLIHPDVLLLAGVLISWRSHAAAEDVPHGAVWRSLRLLRTVPLKHHKDALDLSSYEQLCYDSFSTTITTNSSALESPSVISGEVQHNRLHVETVMNFLLTELHYLSM